MSLSSVEPLIPKMNDMPYSITAEESTPMRKYLIAASFDFVSCLRQPASTNVGIEIVSSATKIADEVAGRRHHHHPEHRREMRT